VNRHELSPLTEPTAAFSLGSPRKRPRAARGRPLSLSHGNLVIHALRDGACPRAGEKARGTLDSPIPQGVDGVPGLKGTPNIAKMLGHRVVESALRVRVPTLIIDAEFEELVDRRQHGQRVFEAIRQRAPAEYIAFPCKHYDIYDRYYPAASEAALAWFQKHLGH
jgi:uncharacterized protein